MLYGAKNLKTEVKLYEKHIQNNQNIATCLLFVATACVYVDCVPTVRTSVRWAL